MPHSGLTLNTEPTVIAFGSASISTSAKAISHGDSLASQRRSWKMRSVPSFPSTMATSTTATTASLQRPKSDTCLRKTSSLRSLPEMPMSRTCPLSKTQAVSTRSSRLPWRADDDMTKLFRFFGTGRCGTGYAAKVCQAAGFKVGHEQYQPHGISSCMPEHHVADTSGRTYFNNILLVRDPVTCCASLQTITLHSWKKFMSHGPLAYGMPETVRRCEAPQMAVRHWLNWNSMLMRMADDIWRIEDVTLEHFQTLFCGSQHVPYWPTALDRVPTNYNARKHDTWTLDDVLSKPHGEQAIKLAKEFGYDY